MTNKIIHFVLCISIFLNVGCYLLQGPRTTYIIKHGPPVLNERIEKDGYREDIYFLNNHLYKRLFYKEESFERDGETWKSWMCKKELKYWKGYLDIETTYMGSGNTFFLESRSFRKNGKLMSYSISDEGTPNAEYREHYDDSGHFDGGWLILKDGNIVSFSRERLPTSIMLKGSTDSIYAIPKEIQKEFDRRLQNLENKKGTSSYEHPW